MTDKAEKKPGRGQAPWRKRAYATHSVHEAVTKLFISLGGADQARLVELWRHWEMVMGEMLAPLGRPLGHKDATLFIGAEDAMAMQELSMQSQEILERANAFMNEAYFDKVKLSLMQDRPDLARKRESKPQQPPAPLPPAPPLGAHLGNMDPDSPVTRCYAAWVRQR